MSIINTNILSLNTQQNLKTSKLALNSAIERLSSGLRINSAKDDAAGQAIANKFTSQIRGLQQASRNAADGMSLAQTAEGGLKEINNNLQRIRELAVQAANGTNANNLPAIQDEIDQRIAEITRVATDTEFNGIAVLKNTTDVKIQVGANDSQKIDLKAIDASSVLASFTAGTDTIATIDTALETVDGFRSQLGAAQNRFESAIANIGTTITNLAASRSAIEDADYATEVSNMSRAQILQQAGTSVLSQANQTTQGVLNLLR